MSTFEKQNILNLEDKIAIIIPFRDLGKEQKRKEQLRQIVNYMSKYLNNNDYKIFVIEQSDDGNKFNRGQLLNIGFKYAEKEGYKNFIFHDVDLLPSKELQEYYIKTPTKEPVHIAAVWDRYNQNSKYFGGIVSFNSSMFNAINGYPNNFWGWGGEDDELYKRTKKFFNIYKPQKGKIKDLENLSLEQKLEYLKENDLKFMQKQEALAEHEKTWNINGLNSLKFKTIGDTSCGNNCTQILVELDTLDSSLIAEDLTLKKPEEFDNEQEFIQEERKNGKPEEFDKLIKLFYNLNPYVRSDKNYELEVKFGTKGIKIFTKNDYDNVIKVLKSFNFETTNSLGGHSLRIRSEFLDSTSGRFKMSDIRTEIDGLIAVEKYCKSNDIKTLYKEYPSSIKFVSKKGYITPEKTIVRPLEFNDFNFRVSLQTEDKIKKGVENNLIENWKKYKKEIRYLNRVTFTHPKYPVLVDISISKSGSKSKDKRGYTNIIPVYTLEESNVFNNPESYEIEF